MDESQALIGEDTVLQLLEHAIERAVQFLQLAIDLLFVGGCGIGDHLLEGVDPVAPRFDVVGGTFEQFAEAVHGEETGRYAGPLLFERALLMDDLGRKKEAIALYSEVIEEAEAGRAQVWDHAASFTNRGSEYAGLGEWDKEWRRST